jgi:hypothetical protein
MSNAYKLPGKSFPINVPHPTLGVPVTIGCVYYDTEEVAVIKGDHWSLFELLTKYEKDFFYSEFDGTKSTQYPIIVRNEEGGVIPIDPKLDVSFHLPVRCGGRDTTFSMGVIKNGAIEFHYKIRTREIYDSVKYYLEHNNMEDKVLVEEEKKKIDIGEAEVVRYDFTFMNKQYETYLINNECYFVLEDIVGDDECAMWEICRHLDTSCVEYIISERNQPLKLGDKTKPLGLKQKGTTVVSMKGLVKRLSFIPEGPLRPIDRTSDVINKLNRIETLLKEKEVTTQ